MEYIGDVFYDYGGGLYVNMTNKCPCRCAFCIRDMVDSLGDADSLWLKREPSMEELLAMLKQQNLAAYDEIVFCGYGEPTERLDCLIAVCDYVKNDPLLKGKLKTRLNTNGLSDLINNKPTAREFSGRLDAISISLNAPTAQKYNELCRPKFGIQSFDEILRFTQEVKQYVPDVTMSVVSGSISSQDVEECRKTAAKLGVKFRVR
ncbi:MAG: TIGR04100 family radical SAM protein [Firmicutes bacterium]|nr:TIGR04100 family radical SAM protein [Bacillota bacterium]